MLGETRPRAYLGVTGAKNGVTLGPVGREPGADFTDLGFGGRLPGIAIAPYQKAGLISLARH